MSDTARMFWAGKIAEARELVEQAGDPMIALIAACLSLDESIDNIVMPDEPDLGAVEELLQEVVRQFQDNNRFTIADKLQIIIEKMDESE